jgi:hypothetical protein
VLLLWSSGGHNAETNQRWFVISFVTTRSEILLRVPTVQTARTLRLFSNCMEHSATWDVLIDQEMYNLLSLTKRAGSVSLSECLALVTAVIFFNVTVLDLGLGLCLSKSNTLFLLILQFRFFNIRVDFNIIFPSDQSPTFCNKYLTINVPISQYFPPFPPLPSHSRHFPSLPTHQPLPLPTHPSLPNPSFYFPPFI